MGKTVLLVDDDQIFNWVLTKMIEKLGYHLSIKSFLDGKAALDYIEQNYSDENAYSILLDVNMPLLNGWDFLDALVKLDYIKCDTMAIHMVSSSTDNSDKERAESYDLVNGFFNKPLTLEHIKVMLDS